MNRHLLVLVLVLAFGTTGFGQAKTDSREEAYYHFSKGRLLDDQGQPAQAVEEYQKALQQDPNNSLIYSEMASSYLRNNRLREAVEAAQKAIQADHDNVEAHKLLSTIYLQVIGAEELMGFDIVMIRLDCFLGCFDSLPQPIISQIARGHFRINQR